MTVLCFIADAEGALREMRRVLRPGGRLVTGELARGSAWAAMRRWRGWLGSALWRRSHFRSAGELRRLAEAAGLSVAETRGAIFFPPLAARDPWLGRRTTLGAAFVALRALAPMARRRA